MADIPAIAGSDTGTWKSLINTVIGLINGKFNARQIQTFAVANAAALAALSGTYTLAEGDMADQADTNQLWRYTGSAWAEVRASIVPTTTVSVGSAPISADGKVSFTGMTTGGTLRVNCNKALLATYSRVILLFDMEVTAGQTVQFVLRLADGSTVNSAASSYSINGSITSAGTLSTFAPALTTSWTVGAARRYQKGYRYEFSDLATAHETSATWKGDMYNIGQTNLLSHNGGMAGHTDAALAADGWEWTFTITGGATVSGTVRVIGEL